MKTIIEMAREAGGADIAMNKWTSWVGTQSTEFLERFAELVRADENEAILDLVDSYAKNNTDLADAIRARGNT